MTASLESAVRRLSAIFAVGTLTATMAVPAFPQMTTKQTGQDIIRIAEMQKTPAAQNTVTAQTEIRKIEWQKDNTHYVYTLQLDNITLSKLRTNPLADDVQGRALVDAMRSRGAVYNDAVSADGEIIPALQQFNAQTGKKI
jgi:hypothetical protein